MERLQEATSRFAAAMTESEVSSVLLAVAEDLLHAPAGVVYLMGQDGELRLQASRDVPASVERWRVLPREAPLPLATAIATGAPVFLSTRAELLQAYPQLGASDAPAEQLQAVAALPLAHGGRVLGGFAVSFDGERTFDDDERRWLGGIAAQAALAADRARLYEAEKRAREEAETLLRLGEALSATKLDLEAIVQHVTDEATRLVGGEFGAFFYNVVDTHGESYVLYTLSGAPREAFAKFGLPRNTPLFAPTFAGQGVVRLDDVKKDPRYGQMAPHRGMPAGHLPVTSYLAVPVVSRSGNVLGGLFFGHPKPSRFTAQHERIAKSLAATAALAIDNAKLYRATRQAEEAQRGLVDGLSKAVHLDELLLGALAHDLRSPLAAVTTAAELIRRRAAASSDERNVKVSERIANSGRRMSRMIEQLLDLTRLRAGSGMSLESEPGDLGAIVRQVIDDLEQSHPGRAIAVDQLGDATGTWDGARLAQVLCNLIGNAVQHGTVGAEVRVSLDGTDAGSVRLRVHNAGAIPGDVLGRLFDPAKRTGERLREGAQALGLGLYISREIVRAHGGDVTVASSEAEGTTFTVSLPRARESAAAAAPAPAELPGDRLQQMESRFRLIVDAVKDYAIFMLDPTGRVMTWNLGAKRIKGYDAAEIIGQHFSRFYEEHEIRAGKCEHELEMAARDGRFEDEGWRLRKDGTRFWANVVITALRDPAGELVGFAKVTRDLTQRRQLEQEKLRVAKAEEAVRLRDDFLALASHELKTPLTVLQMQLDTLHQRLEASDQKVTTKLQRAVQSGERLANLIESLLDVSRIATGKFALELQEFDLAADVEHLVENLRPTAAKVGSDLVLERDGPVVGTWDQLRIEQVVTNLLSNAIKYGAGKPIHVAVRAGLDRATLEVRDGGPGIPEGDIVRLFQRFERAASVRNYGGLGLGLYLIQEIVSAHGGSVSAENLPDGGACFRVTLPTRAAVHVSEISVERRERN